MLTNKPSDATRAIMFGRREAVQCLPVLVAYRGLNLVGIGAGSGPGSGIGPGGIGGCGSGTGRGGVAIT
jgi:hypothetical protein